MKYCLILFVLATLSCNSNSTRIDVVENKLIIDTIISQPKEKAHECTRGVPEPLIKTSRLPDTKFSLSIDSTIGFEETRLNNGDKLSIKNWGCEYYTLTYQFETSRFSADTNNLSFWFKRAEILLTGTLGLVDAPLNIKKGIMHLEYYNYHADKDNNRQQLGEEIDFGGDVIREFISVDRISILKDSIYIVEISISMGPL